MINVAVGWLLYERTGTAWALGLVGAVELAPILFLMVAAGNAADRFPAPQHRHRRARLC